MAWVLYDNFLLGQENGANVDLDTDALKVGLLNSTYVPAKATDTLWSGISANEVSGSNYTAGGATVAGATVSLAASTVTFDINDITWSQHASGFTNARIAVLYRVSDGKLICYHDMVTDKGNQGGDFVLQMDAAGVFTKT